MQVLFIVSNFVLHCCNCFCTFTSKKETWCGVLHHVCREHTWATGQYKHDPINDMESNKKYLEKEPWLHYARYYDYQLSKAGRKFVEKF